MATMEPAKRAALRFRIWQFCEPREWNVSVREIAEALNESVQRVNNAVRFAGWSNRVRAEYAVDCNERGGYQAGRAAFAVGRALGEDLRCGRIEAGVL